MSTPPRPFVMSSRWSEEKTFKFVQLYRQNEHLWHIHNPAYRSRHGRLASMKNIVDEMQIPTFTVRDVPRKIKSLRSTYHLELAKIEQSERSGSIIHKPTLPWFEDMSYIINMSNKKDRTPVIPSSVELGPAVVLKDDRGMVQAKCVRCLKIIKGSVKSTGNFRSHIQKVHGSSALKELDDHSKDPRKRRSSDSVSPIPEKMIKVEIIDSEEPDISEDTKCGDFLMSQQPWTEILDGYKLGKVIIEGKTKKVYELVDDPDNCLLENKDRITAGDGVKAHDLEGKAEISNSTNGKVFQILNDAGIKTAYVKRSGPKTFISKKCEMVPIEWVTRRLATGSFLKRREGVPEGFRFRPPLQETFFKDDANHDPQWSEEQIVSAGFKVNGKTIGQDEVDIMRRTTVVVFEVLERAWATRDCALIDMKIEFGVDTKGDILVADVIDSDSWRLWPSGDKRLMKDKQVYRNLSTVTQEDLDAVKRNFKWIDDQLASLLTYKSSALAVIFMGSPSDEAHCKAIAAQCEKLGLEAVLRVSSAHKATTSTLKILAEYEDSGRPIVLIAVAGRSNGLGPVLSGSSCFPVINCPPVTATNVQQDIWSSINVPSGLGCTTVMYPGAAALAAAQIVALNDHTVWSRLRVQQLNSHNGLTLSDQATRSR